MLDKKQIRAIFLFEFKMSREAAETTHNINNNPGTANQPMVQLWFKKFCKGDRGPENEEPNGWPLETDNNQPRESSKLILLQRCEKLLKNSMSTILWSFGIWSKRER